VATNYDLYPTSSTIQVLSPTLVQPVVDCPLRTKPSGVFFDYWLDQATFDAGEGPVILEAVCAGVEHIMASQPVIAGVGAQQLDANGLLEQFITFTVAYQVPGSTTGPLTVEVDVPVGDFGQDAIAGTNFGLADAENIIQTAYQKLVALAGG
jgi:hypothetical protein